MYGFSFILSFFTHIVPFFQHNQHQQSTREAIRSIDFRTIYGNINKIDLKTKITNFQKKLLKLNILIQKLKKNILRLFLQALGKKNLSISNLKIKLIQSK